jgi:hypothetical protein
MHRRLITLVCALAVATVPSTPAFGSTDRPVGFSLYSGNVDNKDLPMLTQATGAVTGVGSATSDDDVKGTQVPLVFTFPKGKIYATAHVDFDWAPDLKTCTATRHGAGRFTITRGTGIYLGISGRGRYVETGAAIGLRAANGGCQQRFKLNYVVAQLKGTVRL